MMRIITGKARGCRLATLPGENTRPTAERTKEAGFSMLQFDLPGARVLDLFAGAGQMGLEALSRGAAQAVAHVLALALVGVAPLAEQDADGCVVIEALGFAHDGDADFGHPLGAPQGEVIDEQLEVLVGVALGMAEDWQRCCGLGGHGLVPSVGGSFPYI